MTKRNDKCPCGSGKKYKICCMNKDIAEAQEKAAQAAIDVQMPAEIQETGFPTWKIFTLVTAGLGLISLVLAFAFDCQRAAGALFGCGMIVLIMLCAFRNVPSVRKRPGDAGNIDFGNRQ